MSRKAYRLTYVSISTLALLGILIFSATISERYLFETTSWTKYISLILAASGTIVIRAAFKYYRAKEFLGIREENPSGEFETRGILSYIRHPLYTGTILIVLGYFIYTPRLSSLITTCIVLLYLIPGIYLEERKLVQEFGEEYLDYKKKVPALFPRLKDIFSF